MPPEPSRPPQDPEAEFRRLFDTFVHDFRQPLTKILTLSELLADRLPNIGPTEKDYLLRMQEAGLTLKELVGSMSDYVRLTQLTGSPEPVLLGDILNETLADFEPAVREGTQRLFPPSTRILADKALMKQVFRQLIDNAVKFKKAGEAPQIRIEARTEEGGTGVQILVSDAGIGFDEKYALKIFEPFQKLYSKKEYKGAGLGLTIAQKIVQNHGGRMEAAGQLGSGASFRLHLPNIKEN